MMFRPGSSWSSETGWRKRLNCSTRRDLMCMTTFLIAQQTGQNQQGIFSGLLLAAVTQFLQLFQRGLQVAIGLQGVQILLRRCQTQGLALAVPGASSAERRVGEAWSARGPG